MHGWALTHFHINAYYNEIRHCFLPLNLITYRQAPKHHSASFVTACIVPDKWQPKQWKTRCKGWNVTYNHGKVKTNKLQCKNVLQMQLDIALVSHSKYIYLALRNYSAQTVPVDSDDVHQYIILTIQETSGQSCIHTFRVKIPNCILNRKLFKTQKQVTA